MNNKFSDIDKVIITTWLLFGAAVGAFVAPLFHASFFVAGAIGFFAGAFVDYVLFFEPWRGQSAPFSSIDEQDTSTEDEETDISEFIRDSFEAEGIISEDDIEFKNEDGAPELNIDEENLEVEESEENSEIISEEEAETDIGEDTEEEVGNETETEEVEIEENVEEENDLEEQNALPAFYRSGGQIHSLSYDQYEDETPQGLRAWLTPTKLPINLVVVWFFISQFISDDNPEFVKSILPHFPTFLFIIMPIFFLIGLSGLIGLLLREPNETLEMSSKENAAYLINLLKVFAGWGLGIYTILVNL